MSEFEKNGRFVWYLCFVGGITLGIFWMADKVTWVGFVLTVGICLLLGAVAIYALAAAGWAVLAPVVRWAEQRLRGRARRKP